MTARQLAARIDVVPSRIVAIEKAEVTGGITVRSLRQAAAGMNCAFVYAFVPLEPLDDIVRERAMQKARKHISRLDHTMRLENQAVLKSDLDAEQQRTVDLTLSGSLRACGTTTGIVVSDPLFDPDDEANTPLTAEKREGLIPSYITLRHELNEAEQSNIGAALRWSGARSRDILDREVLSELHRQMFGDVWRWAGQYRATARNIGVDAYRISMDVQQAIDDARYWVENDTYPPDEIAVRFSHRLVAIHPFPNGNGRFSRLVGDLLAGTLEAALHVGTKKPDRRRPDPRAIRRGATGRRQSRYRAATALCPFLVRSRAATNERVHFCHMSKPRLQKNSFATGDST